MKSNQKDKHIKKYIYLYFRIACGNGNPGWVQMQDNSDFCYLLYQDSRMFFDDADKYCKQQVKLKTFSKAFSLLLLISLFRRNYKSGFFNLH